MAFLINIFSATQVPDILPPGGLWEWLILTVFAFIKSYGWRVALFTVLLKVLLSPLDIYQRYKARKNQKISQSLQPQIEKLKKQYPDKQQFSQKMMELNKKSGYSYFSACLPAIATLVVFMTLLWGLNNISAYMNFNEYRALYNQYQSTYEETLVSEDYYVNGYDKDKSLLTDEQKDDAKRIELSATDAAQQAVVIKYDEIKESFLWVKNIWSPDVPWTKPINDLSTFKNNIGDYGKSAEKVTYKDENGETKQIDSNVLSDMLSEYETVMAKLLDSADNTTNGYLILPILSILLSVAMQIVSMRIQKASGQVNDAMGAGSMKIMMFMMPVIIGIFSLQYTAAFSIYLIFSYMVSLVINVSSNLLLLFIDKREAYRIEHLPQKYGRRDPNDINGGSKK